MKPLILNNSLPHPIASQDRRHRPAHPPNPENMRGCITVAAVIALLTPHILKGYCWCLRNLRGTFDPFGCGSLSPSAEARTRLKGPQGCPYRRAARQNPVEVCGTMMATEGD
jgi:hypothetical protein